MELFLRRETSVPARLEGVMWKRREEAELERKSSPLCRVLGEKSKDLQPCVAVGVQWDCKALWTVLLPLRSETHRGPVEKGHCNMEAQTERDASFASLSLKHSKWREMRKSLSQRINPTQLSLRVLIEAKSYPFQTAPLSSWEVYADLYSSHCSSAIDRDKGRFKPELTTVTFETQIN